MKKPTYWTDNAISPMQMSEAIKDRVTMPDVIARYVPAAEPRFNRIPCPIHHGKDRNLFYQRERYKCPVCGAGGDVIDFTRTLFGLSFNEAVRTLNADFCVVSYEESPEQTQAALRAAQACREERERQRREAEQDYHRWRDLWCTLDDWLRRFPPGDRRHDDAERDLALVSYRWDCAEWRLNQLK